MKPSDIFGLVVRIVGFLIVVWGLWYVLAGFVTLFEMLFHVQQSHDEQYSPVSYLGMGIPTVVFGALCLFFAGHIVRWTFRDK
jgi:ABC-type phosphate transport system permease subunit